MGMRSGDGSGGGGEVHAGEVVNAMRSFRSFL